MVHFMGIPHFETGPNMKISHNSPQYWFEVTTFPECVARVSASLLGFGSWGCVCQTLHNCCATVPLSPFPFPLSTFHFALHILHFTLHILQFTLSTSYHTFRYFSPKTHKNTLHIFIHLPQSPLQGRLRPRSPLSTRDRWRLQAPRTLDRSSRLGEERWTMEGRLLPVDAFKDL